MDNFELVVKKGRTNLFLGLILVLRHIMCIHNKPQNAWKPKQFVTPVECVVISGAKGSHMKSYFNGLGE